MVFYSPLRCLLCTHTCQKIGPWKQQQSYSVEFGIKECVGASVIMPGSLIYTSLYQLFVVFTTLQVSTNFKHSWLLKIVDLPHDKLNQWYRSFQYYYHIKNMPLLSHCIWQARSSCQVRSMHKYLSINVWYILNSA